MPITADGKYEHSTQYQGILNETEIADLVAEAVMRKVGKSINRDKVKCKVWRVSDSALLNYNVTVLHERVANEL